MNINWLLPEKAKLDNQVMTKSKILVYVMLLASMLSFGLFFLNKVIATKSIFPFIPMGVLSLALVLIYKFTGSEKVIGHIMVCIFSIILFDMTLKTGGVLSLDAICLYMIPLIAFVIIGTKAGMFWTLCSSVWGGYLFYIAGTPEQFQYFREQTLDFDRMYYGVFIFINIILIGGILLIFDYQNKKLIKRLEKNQLDLENKNKEYASQAEILKQTQEKLKSSNKELEVYAHATSHDLKQPIRTINGFTYLLNRHLEKNKMIDDKSSELVKMILLGTNNMQRLVEDLLAYAKLTSSKESSFQIMDLDDVLDNVIMDLKNQIESNNVNIIRGDLPTLKVVPVKINQIFQNIISNAIKFKKRNEDLTIKISSKKKDNQWHLIIEDNGIGIEEKYQEKIFAPFQKLHTEEEYSGSGIGLATCKRIVDLHKGEIWVESELDKGTKFYFTLDEGLQN